MRGAGILPAEGTMKKNVMRLAIEALQSGMYTAEPVLNASGAVIAWQDRELDDSLIARLQGMGIGSLMVYTKDIMQAGLLQREDWHNGMPAEVFRESYHQDVDSFKDMFLEISAGGTLEADATDRLVESIIEKKHDNGHIVDCVMQVRSVDEYTYHHCIHVAMLAMMLGHWMRMKDLDVRDLVLAGLLHDVGKGKVPLGILNKPGPLDEAEYREIKKHAEYGYQIVKAMPKVKQEVAIAVLTHHEREDGSGYPLGLQADKLGLAAKILAIVDVYSAMTANRVYRRHESVFRVFDMMQNNSFGKMDPIVLHIFLKNITHFYVGRRVLMSDGSEGEVIFMNERDFSRPVVQTEHGFVDLLSAKGLCIAEIH